MTAFGSWWPVVGSLALDAPRFVDGAVLACVANPGNAGTVRVYPHDDPRAFRLTGRYIDCTAIAEPRRAVR
jgi:hypothetical protein